MAFCPQCGNQMIDIHQPDQEYCSFCRRYVSVTPISPTQPQAYQQPAVQQQYQQPVQQQTYQRPVAQQQYQQPAYYGPTTPTPSPKKGNKNKIIIFIVIVVAVIISIAAIFVFLLRSDEDRLIGSWRMSEGGMEMIWTFERGGTATMEFMGTELPFSWSINEGRKELTITMSGSTTVLDYRFINDNTLELTDDTGETVRFTRI